MTEDKVEYTLSPVASEVDRVPPARPSVGKWRVVTDIEGCQVVIDSKVDRMLSLKSEGAFRWFIDTLRRAGLNLGWTIAPVWWLTSNRLPEEDQRVLVYIPGRQRNQVTEAIYRLGDFLTGTFTYSYRAVDAWMPLPVPPDEWGGDKND